MKGQQDVDNTKNTPTVLSLCTGYGGIEIGLKRAIGRINVLAHVEVEAFAIANLVDKMESGQMAPAPIWTDIKTLNADIFRGRVDILTGGYPCQPFSVSGLRQGDKDPRHLYPYISKHIDTIRPRYVFFENVEGHLTSGVAEVLADLEKMAYKVECGVFSAAEIGAPHQRKRVFILGYSDSKRSQGYAGVTCTTGRRKVEASTLLRQVARPNERQHDWEQPRVLENPSGIRQHWRCQNACQNKRGQKPKDKIAGYGEPHYQPNKQVEIESKLGRAVNGSANWVDRLRLIGNGVMPHAAELAFRTLYERIKI